MDGKEPRSGEKNKAHGVSRGLGSKTEQAPKGRKKRMPHTTTNLLVHFIFSTKQRCALIKPEFEKDLHAYLGGIVRQIGGTALCVNGTRDHVHLLIRVPINRSVADIARLIKTNSSRWIHERWPEYHLLRGKPATGRSR